ncbi:MAG: hypothetical protein E7587_00730 [Ruminococcaceae bacterium]|nr:hypothetical protein [Oscillospiraceae bacterium]
MDAESLVSKPLGLRPYACVRTPAKLKQFAKMSLQANIFARVIMDAESLVSKPLGASPLCVRSARLRN